MVLFLIFLFWLEDKFDVVNNYEISEKLALGLSYISLSLTVRDDFIDDNQNSEFLILSNIFLTKFLDGRKYHHYYYLCMC